jgi:hypothetical protein
VIEKQHGCICFHLFCDSGVWLGISNNVKCLIPGFNSKGEKSSLLIYLLLLLTGSFGIFVTCIFKGEWVVINIPHAIEATTFSKVSLCEVGPRSPLIS